MKLCELLKVVKTTDIEIALDETQETVITENNYYDVIHYLDCEVTDIRVFSCILFITIK